MARPRSEVERRMPSPPEPIVIVGAGGHGREIYAVIDAVNRAASAPKYDVVGFIDDGQPDLARLARLGPRHLGGIEEMPSDARYLIGIGESVTRERVDGQLAAMAREPVDLLTHPLSWIGPDVEIGPGSIIFAGVSVTTNVRIGRHVHLNRNATVGHDVVVGDFTTLAPGVVVSGGVTIGPAVELGSGAVVLPGVTIGAGARVGAQACVTGDLLGGETAVGVPARTIRNGEPR
jgi:sugar O-acyltransferase (sialic acid O-acetyltransferase NeuD family)